MNSAEAPPVHLDEPRCERKLVAHGILPRVALRLVREHGAHFVQEHPARWVHNVYLDDLAFSAVREHAAGIERRTKRRVRWYGPPGPRTPAVLEQKRKRGQVGTKERSALVPIGTEGGIGCDTLDRVLVDSDLPVDLRGWLRSARPVLANRYRRSYYRSSDGRFRLTVDDELAYATVPLVARMPAWLLERERTILELKYAPELDTLANGITTGLVLRVTKSSKFMTGMRLLYPHLGE